MGGKQIVTEHKSSSLETILDEEIFDKKETGFFKRIKQGIERKIADKRNEVLVPVSLVAGGAINLITIKIIRSNGFLLEQFGRSAINYVNAAKLPDFLMVGLGAGVTYLTLDYIARKHIGKKIIKADKPDQKPKKEKNNFILRHKLSLSLGTVIPFLSFVARKIYLESPTIDFKKILINNYDKVLWGPVPYAVGFIGAAYFFYDQLGKFIGLHNKHTWKNMGIYAVYQISKKDGIRMYEEESKKGNAGATEFLSRKKEDLDEKLELRKKVIENQEEMKVYYGKEYSWAKPYSIGSDYYRFKSKKDINIIIDMAMKLYDVNSDEALKILDKLANVRENNIKSRILTAKTYFLNNREHDKKENWQELRSQLEKEGKLELIEGSEGKSSKHFDDFTNKNFIFKDYTEDKSNKFFIERAILGMLKDSQIRVENPLFYYDEDNSHRQVFIRDGEKNLHEFLEDKSTSERQDYFEKLLPIMMLYQEKVFSALEKQGSGFVMNTEFRGEKRRITIPVLDLETSLMRRAFAGSKPGEQRLGKNDYLPDLLDKLHENDQLSPYQIILTFNRGDTTSTNVTSTFCEIDPRPCIYHPLYDLAYISGDPAFLSVNFDSKKEKVLELILKKERYKGMEADFVKAFDSLYAKLALCNAGANLYLGKRELTRIILNDLIEFSARKPFANELRTYLSHSNAAS
jgi:hypothetical protein